MAPSRPKDRAEVERWILEFIAARVERPALEIAMDVPFAQVGLGSLDAIEILFAVEEELGVTFPDEDAAAVHSARHLVELTLRELGL